jgi:hypothetical protein
VSGLFLDLFKDFPWNGCAFLGAQVVTASGCLRERRAPDAVHEDSAEGVPQRQLAANLKLVYSLKVRWESSTAGAGRDASK